MRKKGKREVSQADVAMATSRSSERWVLLLEIPRTPHEGQAKLIEMHVEVTLHSKLATSGRFVSVAPL